MTLYEEMVASGHASPVQQNSPSQGSKPSLYDEMVASGHAEPALEQPQFEDMVTANKKLTVFLIRFLPFFFF